MTNDIHNAPLQKDVLTAAEKYVPCNLAWGMSSAGSSASVFSLSVSEMSTRLSNELMVWRDFASVSNAVSG